MLLCTAIGVFAYGLLWIVQTPLAFIVAFCFLVPFGAALFSQSFSYSRAYYDRHLPKRSELLMSILRSGFTLAWIITPPVAGWIAAHNTAASVFAISMLAHVVVTLSVGLLWTQKGTHIGTTKRQQTEALPPLRLARTYIFGISAVVLAQVALQINLTVLPLIIIRDLSGTLEQVGLNSAIAAVLEVPVMIGWGFVALHARKETILGIAVTVFAVYFFGMALISNFVQVLIMQAFAAVALAALLSINISYLQEVFPGRVGLSTSLLDVTQVASALIAAVLFAAFAGLTYKPMMVVALVLCLVSAGIFLMARVTKRS